MRGRGKLRSCSFRSRGYRGDSRPRACRAASRPAPRAPRTHRTPARARRSRPQAAGGAAPPRCARPAPSSARRGSGSSGARGLGTRRAAARTSGAVRPGSERGRGRSGGPQAGGGRGGVTPLHPSRSRPRGPLLAPIPPPRSAATGSSRLERRAGPGACARRLGQDVGGAENPSGPARPREAPGLLWRWPAGGAGGFAPCGDPAAEEGPAGEPVGSQLSLRLSARSGGVLRLVLRQIGVVVTLITNKGPRGVALRPRQLQEASSCWGVCLLAAGFVSALGSGTGSFAFLSSQSSAPPREVSYILGVEGRWSASSASRLRLPESTRSLTSELRSWRPQQSSSSARPLPGQGDPRPPETRPRGGDGPWAGGLGRPRNLSSPHLGAQPLPFGWALRPRPTGTSPPRRASKGIPSGPRALQILQGRVQGQRAFGVNPIL